jgi:hypothetical protein
LGPEQPWRPNALGFSHGRAALAWLADRTGVRSAVACAYTCPSVPNFLRGHELPLGLFDVTADLEGVLAAAAGLPAPRLILIPALFGSRPLVDVEALAARLPPGDVLVIDAAQTAFGHLDFASPAGGAVLSCPRKTTGLSDGAVLALGRGLSGDGPTLAAPRAPAAAKAAARALWALEDEALEPEALRLYGLSEESWPDAPCRMSDEAQALLGHLDPIWHNATRRRNRDALAAGIAGLAVWSADAPAPFSLPVFVANRAELLGRLREARIYASALWPDARHDAARHPTAAWLAAHLVSLPVDQRHDLDDMARVADAVNATALAAPPPPEALASRLTRR